jgi:hypothetical protein
MSKTAAADKDRWDEILEHIDMMSTRLNDMGITQQELKTEIKLSSSKVEQCCKEQKLIAQQVQANGQAVAQLILRQFEAEENISDSTGSESLIEEDRGTPRFVITKVSIDILIQFLIMPCPKCFFPSLMGLIQRFGLITVPITSLYMMYLLRFGYHLPLCI